MSNALDSDVFNKELEEMFGNKIKETPFKLAGHTYACVSFTTHYCRPTVMRPKHGQDNHIPQCEIEADYCVFVLLARQLHVLVCVMYHRCGEEAQWCIFTGIDSSVFAYGLKTRSVSFFNTLSIEEPRT